MNELTTNGKHHNVVAIKGQHAVIKEITGYAVINIHNRLIIADEIALVESAVKILEYLNQEVSLADNRGAIDKLQVTSKVKQAIRNYAPATARVEKQTNSQSVVYKCYDVAGNYLGQVKETGRKE